MARAPTNLAMPSLTMAIVIKQVIAHTWTASIPSLGVRWCLTLKPLLTMPWAWTGTIAPVLPYNIYFTL